MSTYLDKDGGSAFPLISRGDPNICIHSMGMTLRDYFAAHAEPFPEGTSLEWMADVLGWSVPNDAERTKTAGFLWLMRANAAYKYLQADAMLEASSL